MTKPSRWSKERALPLARNCSIDLVQEQKALDDIAAALDEAEKRGKETGAVEWGLAYEEGRDSILARLKNPDEAMVNLVYDVADEEGPEEFYEALADHLERVPATPPAIKQEPLP